MSEKLCQGPYVGAASVLGATSQRDNIDASNGSFSMAEFAPPALKALLARLIDYAGIYPPAGLPLGTAVSDYQSYKDGTHAWMLRWLVVGVPELAKLPADLDGSISVVGDQDQVRAATIETKAIIPAERPTYCEISIAELEAVQAAGCFAKIRMGGLKPEAIPASEDVSAFILACAARRLPFKATAGLHHPIRATYPLTYEEHAPKAVMHGFLNVLMAAAFAWNGSKDIVGILEETEPKAFRFDDDAHWRDRSLTTRQIEDARLNFMHSIGSCSFDEPVRELEALGLLSSNPLV